VRRRGGKTGGVGGEEAVSEGIFFQILGEDEGRDLGHVKAFWDDKMIELGVGLVEVVEQEVRVESWEGEEAVSHGRLLVTMMVVVEAREGLSQGVDLIIGEVVTQLDSIALVLVPLLVRLLFIPTARGGGGAEIRGNIAERGRGSGRILSLR
jgi:hypothetical protein